VVKLINNKMLKTLKTLLVLFFFSLSATPVLAGFGISPADVYNTHLKPGDNFEKEITLSRSDINEDLKVVVETDLKEAESWFQFEPGKEFVFPTGQSRIILKIKVNVPTNAELKAYQGVIRIKASSVDTKNSGVSIVKGARMEVNLVTTSLDLSTLVVKGMSISEVHDSNPIKLLMNIENKGNTITAPTKVNLEIQDLTQKTIETLEDTSMEKIDPNISKEIVAEFKNNLGGGEYFGLVKVYLDDKLIHSDRLVFKVINTVETNGKLKQVSFINKIINIIKTNKVETVALLLIPLIPIITGLVVYKFGVLLFLKNFFLVGTLVYSILAITIFSFYHFKWKPANMAKPSDVGSVQGVSIEDVSSSTTPKTINNPPLKVDRDNTNGYPIYRTPDLNSAVVYVATENEKLQVIEEKEDWYQVSTNNGTGGWLQKTSVKLSQ
jgi:hypothetical protein